MLQEKLYPHWAKLPRKWWNGNGGWNRIILFWVMVVAASTVVISVISTDVISWDRLNRDFMPTNEVSRSFLASFILVMDLLIVMQVGTRALEDLLQLPLWQFLILNEIILTVLPFEISFNLMHLFHRDFRYYKMICKQSLWYQNDPSFVFIKRIKPWLSYRTGISLILSGTSM